MRKGQSAQPVATHLRTSASLAPEQSRHFARIALIGLSGCLRSRRSGSGILWAGRWQGCFTAFRASPRRGILARTGGIHNDRSTILSVADFAGFDARGRRGCLCDGWASLGADAPGRRSQQHQSRAVNHSGTASRSSWPVEIINEKTIADFTRVVEQTGILERELLTCSGPNKGGPARWTLTS